MPTLPVNNRTLVIIATILIISLPILATRSEDIKNLLNRDQVEKAAETKYGCPSIDSFCKNGKDIIRDGAYIGFGANLASGSAILASFDGKLTSAITTLTEAKNEKVVTYYLDNLKDNSRVIYMFKGDSSTSRDVVKGEIIGKSLQKIEAYNASLIFQVLKGDPEKPQRVIVDPINFTF